MRRKTIMIGVLLLASCSPTRGMAAGVRVALAPTGTLRAAINFGKPIIATRDPDTVEPRGLSVDLSRELARRLGMSVQFVTYAVLNEHDMT